MASASLQRAAVDDHGSDPGDRLRRDQVGLRHAGPIGRLSTTGPRVLGDAAHRQHVHDARRQDGESLRERERSAQERMGVAAGLEVPAALVLPLAGRRARPASAPAAGPPEERKGASRARRSVRTMGTRLAPTGLDVPVDLVTAVTGAVGTIPGPTWVDRRPGNGRDGSRASSMPRVMANERLSGASGKFPDAEAAGSS